MWERKQIKNEAKKVVQKNYWTAIVVCFLIALLTGEFGTSIIGVWQADDSVDPNYILDNKNIILNDEVSQQKIKSIFNNDIEIKTWKIIEANLNSVMKPQKYIFKLWDAIELFYINQVLSGVILCITAIIALFFTIIIADPLIVGGKKYFLKARDNSNTKINIIVEVFKKENWFNIAIIMLLKNIYNALWYLTIIGGIIKTYEYRMIPYILAENPKIERKEAFTISKQMMQGNKWKTFILDISFIGWDIISVMTFGILSILYVNPYNAATNAELYVTLKKQLENN